MDAGGGTVKELWLFTRQFPTGAGEVFLETALPVWAKRFSKVRVFHMFTGEGVVELPVGITAEQPWKDPFATPGLIGTGMGLPLLLRILRVRGSSLSDVPIPDAAASSNARQLVLRYSALESIIKHEYEPQRVVLLSTWLEDWATLLGLLREAGHPVQFSSMAHRTDLFGSGGKVPYQALQMRTAHHVLCIARDGVEELSERHPAQAAKLRLVRLGTVDRGPAPWSPSEELRLVSCSYITPRKRVERIAEVLLHVKRPVRWTHFGDGPGRAAVEAIAQRAPANVHIDLRGATSNPQVLEAYAIEPFDAFIHLSAHEGVPVALMEAASFGIPLLATDAGGVKEIVDARTGVLWPVDIAPEEVARRLDSTAMDALRTAEFRAGVRAAWQERFEAERAYGHIADLLLGTA